MALVCVEAINPSTLAMAEELAKRWKVGLCATSPSKEGVKVVVADDRLGLGFVDVKRGKPYFVDFTDAEWKARLHKGLPRNHIFRRALGVHDESLKIVDATAGFGQDSVMALALGCEVIAVEKSPVVAEILRNGVERARQEDEKLKARFNNLKIVEADARVYLESLQGADVVYLDPMFEKPKKTAKSPKSMQLLQDLLGSEIPSEEELFAKAFQHARSRVVVKRPLRAKALVKAPTHSYKGQSIRYDVYVK